MRLQHPDQLSTVLIWITAIYMAVKEAFERWPAGVAALPQVMSWGWLNFVPVALLSLAMVIKLIRLFPARESKPAHAPPVAMPSIADLVQPDHDPSPRPTVIDWRYMPNLGISLVRQRIAKSLWAKEHSADEAAIQRELLDKLYLGRLKAFGRGDPNAPPQEIPVQLWQHVASFDKDGNALDSKGVVAYYDVQLNSIQVRNAWPGPSWA